MKGHNGQVYTDPLAWKLCKQGLEGRWERSACKDHWRSIEHTDTRHPDDSEYRTLSLGTVKELRNATANLLSERGGGGGSGDSGGGGDGGREAVSRGRGAAEEPVVEAESDLEEEAAEKIAELAEKIAGKAQAQQQYHQKEKAANTKKRSRSVDDLKTKRQKRIAESIFRT